jgi:hypothetical protein
MITGFIGLFDTTRDYTLRFTVTHAHARTHTLVSTITTFLAVAR